MNVRICCSGITTSFGVFYGSKCMVVKAHRMYSIKPSYEDDQIFFKWAAFWFRDVDAPSPVFSISGNNVKVLTHPKDFYEELLERSSTAQHRITLASLYIGNGEKEQKLVDTIYENMKASASPIELNVLLEYTRASRGKINSRTLLHPLVKDFHDSTKVSLFHTPNLRGLLRAIVPERFNETINVAHLKVYLFDDTLIMSGANLSHDYFTNRQDRYIIFENCKELCDYFEELVKTISTFSLCLKADDTVELHPLFPFHPYKGKKKKFNTEAGNLLRKFMGKYSAKAFQSTFLTQLKMIKSTTNEAEHSADKQDTPVKDTLVFPLLQMRTMGVQQDELVTQNIIETAPVNTDLLLATAYFNLTNQYWTAILKSKPKVDLIMAHPKAMGFYKAPGMAGGIPNAYSLIAKRKFKELIEKNETERVKFLEFHREGWTFHGKGLWAYFEQAASANKARTSCSPLLTLIGSPNFGKRSVYRDMECQLGVVTVNEKLKGALIDERDRMRNDTVDVTMKTYDEGERKVVWWVYLIATFMNELF